MLDEAHIPFAANTRLVTLMKVNVVRPQYAIF